uniref:Androgen induced inhibitor of proliferation (As3) / pds5, putative n=1 Tax=Arundo donax TaxID=35708 RepID=A0A0A9IQF6_ARUDO
MPSLMILHPQTLRNMRMSKHLVQFTGGCI